jgi:hypothetical protein
MSNERDVPPPLPPGPPPLPAQRPASAAGAPSISTAAPAPTPAAAAFNAEASGGSPAVTPSVAPRSISPHVLRQRDRIVIIGRRRAGKTIFLARLYEALWQGCTLVNGRVPTPEEANAPGKRSQISCRASTGAAHTQFMRVVEELKAGRWPAATVGSSYAELIVEYNGREHTLTALDYPGEVFRKAFMGDSDEPDALELLSAIDRAAAAIFLIDPQVVSAGGAESHEDTFGLTQAAARIRSGAGGESVPIAVVLTKYDLNRPLIKEVGGVKEFAKLHFGQLFKSIERTSVFASIAVRVAQNSLGKVVPRADRPAENVVEPLRYCLELMSETPRAVQPSPSQSAAIPVGAPFGAETDDAPQGDGERTRSGVAWMVFAIATIMLFVTVVVAAMVLGGW